MVYITISIIHSYFPVANVSLSISLYLMFWKQKVVIIVQKHHFFLLISSVSNVLIEVVLIIVFILWSVLTVFLQFFKFICVSSSNKLTIHIKDLTLRVHQKFSIISFNLDSPHYHIVFHVDTYLLSFFSRRLLSFAFICCWQLP